VFVVAASVVGTLIGQRNLSDAQEGNGQSGTAVRAFGKAFSFHSGEEVFVQVWEKQNHTWQPPAKWTTGRVPLTTCGFRRLKSSNGTRGESRA
jgi:hypothetical protein